MDSGLRKKRLDRHLVSPVLRDVEESKNTDTILGHTCNSIRVISNKNSRTFVYSPTLYLDPVHYDKYVWGHANEYYSRAKAPYLAYTYEGKYFTTVYRAVRIEEKQLDDSLFELEIRLPSPFGFALGDDHEVLHPPYPKSFIPLPLVEL